MSLIRSLERRFKHSHKYANTTNRYGNLEVAPNALEELNITAVGRLLQWKADLPAVLQVDTAAPDDKILPHVLLLQ